MSDEYYKNEINRILEEYHVVSRAEHEAQLARMENQYSKQKLWFYYAIAGIIVPFLTIFGYTFRESELRHKKIAEYYNDKIRG
jgi:hypothetical protein